jgi:hypothetical protein
MWTSIKNFFLRIYLAYAVYRLTSDIQKFYLDVENMPRDEAMAAIVKARWNLTKLNLDEELEDLHLEGLAALEKVIKEKHEVN